MVTHFVWLPRWLSGKQSAFIEPFNFSFFSITGQDIDLDYCGIEWFTLETNQVHYINVNVSFAVYPHAPLLFKPYICKSFY